MDHCRTCGAVRIDDQLVRDNERMLTDGFYGEVTLAYDGSIAQEKGGRPFSVAGLRPIQMSKPYVLDIFAKGRRSFSTAPLAPAPPSPHKAPSLLEQQQHMSF